MSVTVTEETAQGWAGRHTINTVFHAPDHRLTVGDLRFYLVFLTRFVHCFIPGPNSSAVPIFAELDNTSWVH